MLKIIVELFYLVSLTYLIIGLCKPSLVKSGIEPEDPTRLHILIVFFAGIAFTAWLGQLFSMSWRTLNAIPGFIILFGFAYLLLGLINPEQARLNKEKKIHTRMQICAEAIGLVIFGLMLSFLSRALAPVS
jgi:cytochrome c biogenesis protein CcdA